ncbi:MAG TPA: hypothetical protein VEC36_14075, partial [Patescibacteria group bacterium]|nr:hypothetical protein [Patescibacteria group bacterium]
IAGLGTVVGCIAGMFPVFDPETFPSYLEVLRFTIDYSKLNLTNQSLLHILPESTGTFFTDYYTIAFTVILLSGVIFFFKNRMQHGKLQSEGLIFYSIFTAILLFISIIAEKKFLPYHFLRLYVPLAIITSYGAKQFLQHFKSYSFKKNLPVLLPLILCLLILSPLARYGNFVPMIAYFFSDTQKYDTLYERPGLISVNRVQQKEVAKFIKQHLRQDEIIHVMSIGGMPIYNFAGQLTASKFGQSQFYFAKGIPEIWKKEMYNEVARCSWLVIQKNDVFPGLNAHDRTSWESFTMDAYLHQYVQENFTEAYSTDDFIVFKKQNR